MQVVDEHESVEQSRRAQAEPINLDSCLRAFTSEEELGENEMYYCSKCKTHCLATKKLDLWRLPPILVCDTLSLRGQKSGFKETSHEQIGVFVIFENKLFPAAELKTHLLCKGFYVAHRDYLFYRYLLVPILKEHRAYKEREVIQTSNCSSVQYVRSVTSGTTW